MKKHTAIKVSLSSDKLVLRKEIVRELVSSDLTHVVGGNNAISKSSGCC
jgi:hypothetical protein